MKSSSVCFLNQFHFIGSSYGWLEHVATLRLSEKMSDEFRYCSSYCNDVGYYLRFGVILRYSLLADGGATEVYYHSRF